MTFVPWNGDKALMCDVTETSTTVVQAARVGENLKVRNTKN